MQKGKLGFSLWFYPFVAMWTVLMGPALASFIIAGFVMAVEKDEWAIRQCLHVIMFNIYWNVYQVIMDFFVAIPLLGMVIGIIDFIVFVVMLILVLTLGLGRLKRGGEILLPGKGIVNRAYEVILNAMPPQYQPTSAQSQQSYQGYAQPQQQQPYQAPQGQPYQPQTPSAAPQQWQEPAAPPPAAPQDPSAPQSGGLKPPPPPPPM